MKNNHKQILIFLIILFSFNCNSPTKQSNEDEKKTIDVFMPPPEVVAQEEAKKKALLPNGFETPWVIGKIEEYANSFDLGGKSVNEIDDIYKLAIQARVFVDIAAREYDFETIKNNNYPDVSCDITINKIKKGDIVLLVTRLPILMAIDRESSPTHAMICIRDPTGDDDPAFITANGYLNMNCVHYYALEDSKQHGDIAVVLRLYHINDDIINKIVSFAINQVGKEFNTDYIDKNNMDKFYCSQLVWKAYLEAGVNIDYDNDKYNDYGLALASDIYKSPYLYIVDFSE